jgi:predicted CoA-binding protein
MVTKEQVDRFFAQKPIAAVGVSRSEMEFGQMAYRELKTKGYTVYPVNPNADRIGEDTCYPDIASIPGKVGAVLSMVPASRTLEVVQQADAAGVKDVWIQQGVKAPEAVAFCKEKGINVITGHCILMFVEPVGSIHKFHRFFWKLFGLYPKSTRGAA